MWETLLVVQPGKLAERIDRAAERIGVSLAAHGERRADRLAPIDVAAVLESARRTGADAVWAGDVTPFDRVTLARTVREAGLTYVGLPTSTLELLADKMALREVADRVGLRTLPGAAIDADGTAATRAVEFPAFIKPVRGARGVGIERVEDRDEFAAALERARTRCREGLRDEALYLEQEAVDARSIVVVLLRDLHGEETVLEEREVTLQRAYEPILSETPSPALLERMDGDSVRLALEDYVIRMGRELGVTGVISFEFLIDASETVWFIDADADDLGAATATELVYGVDTTELTLSLCRGASVPDWNCIFRSGHAFEALLAAEDPHAKFAAVAEASTGLRLPMPIKRELRFELTPKEEEVIPHGNDTTLAWCTSFDATRHRAFLKLDRALASTDLGGKTSTKEFLRAVTQDECFRAGLYDSRFAKRIAATLKPKPAAKG
ncbi:MAG: hypothetical protein R3A78_10230 [Polyangiales bacterium]|nr:ATP-grasp domain-containing protein [Myxococcales bacterium]